VIFAGSHFIGGALLGLAGSLHCAGVCGGIASTLLMATSPAGAKSGAAAAALVKIQLGRALSYALFGAVVGGGGAAFGELLDLSGMQIIFRTLAACTLVWAGCSVAGLGRGFPAFDRVLATVANAARPSRPFATANPVVMGVAWGFAPCGMVYAALLNAMMTASAAGGAEFMAGFGLATIPAVASAAFGVTALAGLGRSLRQATRRRLLGAAIAALGLLSLVEPAASLSVLCLGR
jgi:sulfite exporter TauE/SafE